MKTTYNAKRLINHPTAFDFSAGVFLLKALYEARTEGRYVTIVTACDTPNALLAHFSCLNSIKILLDSDSYKTEYLEVNVCALFVRFNERCISSQ